VVLLGVAHTDRPPSRFCTNHPNGTPERCGDCANARTAFKAWQEAEDELEQNRADALDADRRMIRDAIDNCDQCDDFGRTDDLEPCPNHPTFIEGRRAHV
jgi:hypothetical protein